MPLFETVEKEIEFGLEDASIAVPHFARWYRKEFVHG